MMSEDITRKAKAQVTFWTSDVTDICFHGDRWKMWEVAWLTHQQVVDCLKHSDLLLPSRLLETSCLQTLKLSLRCDVCSQKMMGDVFKIKCVLLFKIKDRKKEISFGSFLVDNFTDSINSYSSRDEHFQLNYALTATVHFTQHTDKQVDNWQLQHCGAIHVCSSRKYNYLHTTWRQQVTPEFKNVTENVIAVL